MPWKQRGLLVLLVGLIGLVIAGRFKQFASEGLGPNPIKGATYASAIPVYPGAKFTDIMGGNYYETFGGPVTFNSQSWFFDVADPMDKVVQFYRTNLPVGAHEVEAEAGDVVFEWTPPGAAEGEDVTVRISQGQLQIGETVKAKSDN